jgi:hypothetical protein
VFRLEKPLFSIVPKSKKKKSVGKRKMLEVQENMKKVKDQELNLSDFDSIFDLLEEDDQSTCLRSKRRSSKVKLAISSSQKTCQSTPPKKQKAHLFNNAKQTNLSIIDEGSDESLRDSKVFSNVSINLIGNKLT